MSENDKPSDEVEKLADAPDTGAPADARAEATEAQAEAAPPVPPEPAAEAEPEKEKKPRRKRTEAAHAQPETDAPSVEAAAAAALEVAESEAAAPTPVNAPDLFGFSDGTPNEEVPMTPSGRIDESEPPVGEGYEPPERLKSIIESLVFAADKPLSVRKLQELTGEKNADHITSCLEFLRADYGDRGVVLHEVAGGFQFRTNPLNAHWVQQLIAGKPVKLSRAQLETLAIVGYRQPITRPEIDEIRGVDSSGTLKVLLDRRLVRILGKKEEPGRPMLYGTTRDFLEFFNLKDLKELPTLREFYELNEDSMAKIRELDERRAAEGVPAAGQPVTEAVAETVADETAKPPGDASGTDPAPKADNDADVDAPA